MGSVVAQREFDWEKDGSAGAATGAVVAEAEGTAAETAETGAEEEDDDDDEDDGVIW